MAGIDVHRKMRAVLNQAAHAAIRMNGSVFQVRFRRFITHMTYKAAIWAIAHRLCRLIWKILHQGVRYDERGPAVTAKAKRMRLAKMIRELSKAGYRVELPAPQPATPV